MIIKSLSALNYRNLETINLNFNSRLNIIIGDNGQGKTNIIESLYLISEGESFRYSKNENLISIGKNFSLIKTSIVNNDLDYLAAIKLFPVKKELFINEKKTTQKNFNVFSAVLFSPESLGVIKESSDQRRQLVDQLIVQTISTGKNLIYDYRKVLKSRNKLLKDLSEDKIPRQILLDTLFVLNQAFLKLATDLTYARIQLLNTIKPYVEEALAKINSELSVKFDFDYIISDQNHKNSDQQTVYSALRKRLSELETAELKSGISLVGPQKHDVIFLYNGNDSRFYCSQGQQRSIILAYKMAQIVYHHRVHGFYPLLLLDDVLSELDLKKQESLISTLNQTETQTFVTTTDVSLLSKLSMNKASVFKIKNGQILSE